MLSYNRAADPTERVIRLTQFDMALNELGSKEFSAPWVKPTNLVIYDEKEFLISGTQWNSFNFDFGTSPNSIYFRRESIYSLNNKYYNPSSLDLILLYPNPSMGEIHMEAFSYPGVLEMYNLNDKPILRKELNSYTDKMEAYDLPAGLYLWKYTLEDGRMETGKWMKQ